MLRYLVLRVELLSALGHRMKIKDIVSVTYAALSKLSRNNLLRTIQILREKCIKLSERNNTLETENRKLLILHWGLRFQSCIQLLMNSGIRKQKNWRREGIIPSISNMKNLFKACLVSSGVIVGILLLTIRFQGYPRSIFPLDCYLDLCSGRRRTHGYRDSS